MAHDGQDLHMKPTLIPDLLALTGAALEPLDQLLEAARASVKDMVSSDGRVSGKLIEEKNADALED